MNISVSTEFTEHEQNILKKRLMFNDNVLNFYLEYLEKKYGDKSVCVLSTFFFENMRRANDPNVDKEGQFYHCSRWFSKKDLELKDLEYIIIPINVERHWTLLIYCLQSDRMLKGGKRKFCEEYEFDQRLNLLNEQIKMLAQEVQMNLSSVDENNIISEHKYNECILLINKMKELINHFEITEFEEENKRINEDIPLNEIAPCVLNLDSLNISNTPKFLSYTINEFIAWMYQRINIYWDDLEVNCIHVNVPQQPSNWECGEYLLYFVRIFLQYKPKTIKEFRSFLFTEDPTKERDLIQNAAIEMGFH
ncbi:hypothetical protein ENUP19_0304G0034 [Entamoeba nuttalli]|uniref:Ulp1 protease family, C-terminal catalytic domain containing protein n=2 Tax=Entamoeba nuttalli TaxID=412467 RepID=K2H3U2_ENTNP|nr:Ulp1 protease family, C-terminal catalytic domain containing protein [Entamoeba nuttalli P19]EKE42133.1 Ulp1 protease family, C-terminal catalytic domain containing protein [Entamoeba nuttalli P19]|eukprot:XP_008855538.1 Ulp1 protease family, C-terminal catalytic domain containing protein [Entamoeba nuttalli P19]